MARIREESFGIYEASYEGPLADYLEERLQRVNEAPKILARLLDKLVDQKVLSLKDVQDLFGYGMSTIELVGEEIE